MTTKIGRTIREVRKRLGLRQEEFASKLNLSQTTVSRWESGAQEPSYDQLKEVGRLADLDAAEFAFSLTDDVDTEREVEGRQVYIVGTVEEGAWNDSIRWHPDDHVRTSLPLEFPDGYRAEAYRVIADSNGDRQYPNNSIVFVALFDDRFLPRNGDTVLYMRRDGRELVELTLRRFHYFRDGTVMIERVETGSGNVTMHDLEVVRAATSRIGGFGNLGIIGLVFATFIDVASQRLRPRKDTDE